MGFSKIGTLMDLTHRENQSSKLFLNITLTLPSLLPFYTTFLISLLEEPGGLQSRGLKESDGQKSLADYGP